jgi:hypothetical protein
MVLEECDLFIFTFGLTETWMNTDGQVYSSAPGVEAGSYDPSRHVFKNFDYVEVLEDFMAFRQIMRDLNPAVKFLVTVSPVPLAATAADRHVLTATIRSKSVLRAVADRLYETCEDVDYFPSYDMLSSPFLGPSLFEANKRDVSPAAVRLVMKTFLAAHLVGEGEQPAAAPKRPSARRHRAEDPACEEALLDAFAP